MRRESERSGTQALQSEQKTVGLRPSASRLGEIENRTGARNLSQAKIQIF